MAPGAQPDAWAPAQEDVTVATAATIADVKQKQQQQELSVLDDAQPLFQPLQLGKYRLAHRVVMAPLTRNRAPGTVPMPAMATYYGQRATAGGLIITEATCVSQQGQGYLNVPGIHSQEQVEAWRPVVQAVHAKGGLIFCQLWHVGRVSHQDYQPDGGLPVFASALPIPQHFTLMTPKGGPYPHPTPRALELHEIPGIVRDYTQAAVNAIAAGFDGVEIHGANGYLLDHFWKDSSNKRTDVYGGSIENQARLMLEVVEAVAAAIGPDRTAIRLSPYNDNRAVADDSIPRAIEKNVWLVQQIERRVPQLAYIHMVEPRHAHGYANEILTPLEHTLNPFRRATRLPFIVAGGYVRDTAIAAVRSGDADAVAIGRYFISNPNLVARFATNLPLTKYDRDTFYSRDCSLKGYIDYEMHGGAPPRGAAN